MNTEPRFSGKKIVADLTELRDALRADKPIGSLFTIRKVTLDLEPEEYNAEAVRRTRMKLSVSQAVFAQLLAVSVATVRSWEQGVRRPEGSARRLLDLINKDRKAWIKMLHDSLKTTSPR